MKQRVETTSREQRGFTLTEVIVATAIFAIIFVGALLVYDRANRTFKTGVESAEMQQNVRVAYDKMVSDIRMAGFDYDRDGIPSSAGGSVWQANKSYGPGNVVVPITSNGFTYTVETAGISGASQPAWNTTLGGITIDNTVRWTTQAGINQYQQPDEQIEYAGAHALTIRANYDYEIDIANENGRETALQNAQFPVITTANDEIVTYALRSTAPGAPNNNTIEFYADVPDRRSFPGGRAENLVQIPDVDLCLTGCNYPPYTLYRFTLASNGTIVEAPLANNIRDLTFQYYSGASAVTANELTFNPSLTNVTPPSSGGGQYNPNNPIASTQARGQRSRIKSIKVSLTGMAEAPEMGYVNPDEAATSLARGYKTYKVESLVVPRNLGKIGAREQQSAPPGAPRLARACAGYCGMVYVEWLAPTVNDTQGGVEQYVVVYDTVNPPSRYTHNVGPATFAYVPVPDATQSYYFTVTALNSFGSAKALETSTAVSAANRNTSGDPSLMSATGGSAAGSPAALRNQIDLAWTNPITESGSGHACWTNAALSVSATGPAGPGPGEISTYEIIRGENPNFNPGDPDQFVVVGNIAPNVLSVGPSNSSFTDRTAVPCKNYYYRIRGIENSCYPANGSNNQGGASPLTGNAPYPRFPIAPAVHGIAGATSSPDAPNSLLEAYDASGTALSNLGGGGWNIYLSWDKVKQDDQAAPVAMTVDTYEITRERWIETASGSGTYVIDPDNVTNGPNTVTFDAIDSTPSGGAFFTSLVSGSDEPYYIDEDLPPVYIDPIDPLAASRQYQYRYTVRAKLACSPVRLSAPSPEMRYPCPFSGGAPTITLPSAIDGGPATTPGTAWLTDGSGSSLLQVSGTGITSVQVLLSDMASSSIIDFGTIAAAPFDFALTGLEPGAFYRIYIVSRDAGGCSNVQVRYLEEGTPSGCCLAARADNPLVVQFSPGSSVVDIYLFNECNDPLQVQANGVLVNWDPTTTGLPVGTRLTGIEYPSNSGGPRVVQSEPGTGNSTGFVTQSIGGTAMNPIPASSTYRLQVQFNQLLPTNPITNVCITYIRPGLDDPSDPQRCRVVNEPITFNSCN